jgi:hypothetical protein
MKNNSYLFKLFSLLFFITGTAQSQITDYTILWDVTWSMKGSTVWDNTSKTFTLDPELDIWDETKDLIIETINNIPTDGTSNVLIYPFDNPGANKFKLEYKQIDGLDEDERDQLIEWVRVFDGPPMHLFSNTNVCLALDNVYEMNSMASKACRVNQNLYLFTDGKQNVAGYNSETCVDDFMAKFCDDLCDCPNDNKLFNFILKAYKGSGSPICKCVIVVNLDEPTPDDCKILKPIILDPVNTRIVKGNKFIKDPKLDLQFRLRASSFPSDFKLSIDSNNNNLIIKEYSFDTNTKVLSIVFEKPIVPVDSFLEVGFNLFGETDDECYEITIHPFSLRIENKFIPTAAPYTTIKVVKSPNY